MANLPRTPKSWKRKATDALLFGLLLVIAFYPPARVWLLQQAMAAGLFQPEMARKELVAGAAPPAFSFTVPGGATRSTAALKGKIVFINFWATWCPPCRAEMPALQDLYDTFREHKDIVFLFLNEDEDKAKAAAYLKKGGFDLPLTAVSGTVPEAIYGGTLPTTVVLDKEGRVSYRHEGLADYNSPAFIQRIKELL